MPLIKTKYILAHAMEHKYGLISVNIFNYETAKWVIQAAEREQIPIMVQLYPGFDSYIPNGITCGMLLKMAERAAVPVAAHMDHSATYEIAVSGIRDGFPSVMVDGSSLPYEDNVALTAAVAQTARVFNVDVEGELGHVGSGQKVEEYTNPELYTDPDQAVDFMERTGCVSLAVAVGNAHGEYIQTPSLDFERIRILRQKLSMPLVLHGGSHIPDEQLIESIRLGMTKFNIATEFFRAVFAAVAVQTVENPSDNFFGLMKKTEEDAIDFMRGKIRVMNPGKYKLTI